MTMKTANVHLLCQDLDKLLKDICDFLTTQVNDENFSESQRLFAKRLVQRSKTQLTQISQVSVALSTDADEYVDMNKPSVEEEPTYADGEDEDNEYTPIVCDVTPLKEQPLCPYKELPAKELNDNIEKLGPLDKKSKFLVFERQKRLFAAIKDNWLLLYSAKSSPRPLDNLNLTHLIAKPIEGVKTKTFALSCTRTQETFYFVAQTPKDMAQWVACINKRATAKEEVDSKLQEADESEDRENVYERVETAEASDAATLRKKLTKPLPPIPNLPENHHTPYATKQNLGSEEILEEYDSIYPYNQEKSKNEQDDNAEQIYDVIEDIKAQQLEKSKAEQLKKSKAEQLKKSKAEQLEKSKAEQLEKHKQDLHTSNETKKPLPPTPPPLRMPKAIEELRSESIMSTNSDFSDDEDEERIYDILQQPLPNESNKYVSKKRPDSEFEEEYCNLAVDGDKHRLSEPEETYTNLVSIQNTINRKDSQNYKTFKRVEITEPEEEYSNLVVMDVIPSKGTLLSEPVVNRKLSTPTKLEIVDVEEEEEYDYIHSVPSNNTASNTNKLNMNFKIELQTSINEKLKKPPPIVKPKPPKLGKR